MPKSHFQESTPEHGQIDHSCLIRWLFLHGHSGKFLWIWIVYFSSISLRQASTKVLNCSKLSRLKTLFIWPLFTFSQIAYNKQLHKFLSYMVQETSIKTTCGHWHGSYLYVFPRWIFFIPRYAHWKRVVFFFVAHPTCCILVVLTVFWLF